MLVQKMKELEREEARQNEIKRQKIQKMNEEIIETNRKAILISEQKKAKEKEEEQKIVQYLREKAEQEAEIVAEQK